MTAQAYGKFVQHVLKGDIDFDTAALKAMVCGSGYAPDVDAHEFRSSVTSEVSGTGYTAGGVALTGVAVTLDTTNNRLKIDAADADFGTVTFTAGTQIVVYVNTGSAATDYLMSFHTFTSASPTAANFTYAWHADGIGYFSY